MNIERRDSTVIFQIVQATVVILRIVYRGFLTADINGRAGLVLGRRHNRLELTAVTQSSLPAALRVAHAGIMQWKDVDRPTFTQICNSAINWLDYSNSFSGIQTDCLWQTICILERQLLVSITQNKHSSYSMSSSRKKKQRRKLSLRSLTFS